MKENYVDKGLVRLIFKNFPLPSHALSANAAEAAECAADQGAFWEMKHLLFEKTAEWGATDDLTGAFVGYAGSLGLDSEAFYTCYDSGLTQVRWQQDVALGQQLQVSGTPNFFIIRMTDRTGGRIPGFIEYSELSGILDQLLAEIPG